MSQTTTPSGADESRPDPSKCIHHFPAMFDPRKCVRCGWDFRNGEPPEPSGADVDIAALCDKQVTDWKAAGKMEPYAWDFRGFAADAIARYRAETDPAVAALIARNAELEAESRPHETVTHDAGWFKSYPYFDCRPEQWEQHTEGMTDRGKRTLANMLAHHCLLAQRDELGWIITRFDLINEGRPYWHVSNDGQLTYNYDPATKAARTPAKGNGA